MTPGPAARTLTPTPVRADESVLALLPALRAALSGDGPALLLHGAADTSGATDSSRASGEERELGDQDDDPADPTALAVTTSGSTGAAKTVLLPASALLASAGATHDRLGGAGHWLLALPAQHIAGAQVLVRSLIAGTTPTVLDLTAGFTAEGFIEAAGRVGVSRPTARRYTALVPTQLTRLLTAPGETGARAIEALRRFDAILIGGAATSPALREQARAAGVHLVTTYGMSETCGGCVYDGVPLDGVTLHLTPAPRIPRDHARSHGPADPAEPGRVHLGGPMIARGYLDLPSSPSPSSRDNAIVPTSPSGTGPATDSPFSTGPDGVRWFRTDDAGTFQDGRLRIIGRLDSVIISGGVNIAPGPVEAALQRLPGVAEAVVVGLPDAEWGQRVAAALVLVPGAPAPTLAAVRALVSAEVSGPAAPRQLTVLAALPLRGPGKPDRAAIEKALISQPPLEGL